ncbi:hypothetical protein EZV62_000609 [Acer yangbiense]|uniref:S-locus glycoprotein domain-containing protein n=1 Tax=Acer yangbiense TaxID=1000413 RepID=A0A5C7IRS9_9ROSI|nr:hypothetical protein EZV62_000609 [Acer yangbiense]
MMKNNGNLVLLDSSSKIIWHSFDSPTDTILPGQVLPMGTKLYSNANGTIDYSTGQYRLEIQMDGNLVLSAFRFGGRGYWNSVTLGNQNVSLIFNQSTAFIDRGDLQQWIYNKRGGNQWTLVWRAITEPCIVNSICGAFGLCTSPDNNEVTCKCLTGYSPLDPNNPSRGCYPDVIVDFCDANSSTSDPAIEEYNNTDFLNDVFADLSRFPTTDVNECKKAVLDDCFCLAGVWSDSRCMKKRLPLMNARRSNPSTNNMVAFIKVPKMENQDQHRKDSPSWVVLLAVFLSCSILALIFGIAVVYNHPLTQPYIHGQPSAKPKSLHRVTEELHQVDEGTQVEDMILVDWVLCCVNAGNLRSIVSHDLEVLGDFKRFETMTMIGLWCICSNPTLRPSMKKVIQMLEGTVEVGVPPEVDAQIS